MSREFFTSVNFRAKARSLIERANEILDEYTEQSCRAEVSIEKSALIGMIEPGCQRWRTPHMALRGYDSHSELYAAGKRFAAHRADGFRPVLFHLGDHDPSGLDMTRNLREEISFYARYPVEVVRLGLNLGQVREFRLPPNPAKQTDKRYDEYVRITGQTDSWELDALSPAFIAALVENAVRRIVDHAKWQEALEREQANKDLLTRLAERFDRGGEP
jgi:hypothetical protein